MDEVVAVQLTAQGAGAVGCVLLAGADVGAVVGVLEAISGRAGLERIRLGAAVQGRLRDGEGGVIDDSLLVRVDVARWEIHVHGGVAVVEALLEALRGHGVRILAPAEAAERGLLGTPLEGEVLVALGRARTMTATRLLLAQPEAWRAWGERWRARIAGREGELWRFHAEVQWRLERSRAAMHLLEPPRVAIIGPPNAGKSTLANAMLGRPVAITSDVPGTTRDWVDAETIFAGKSAGRDVQMAVTLIDTAGVRETTDAIESESIVRSHAQARAADAVILLFDATRVPTPEELALAAPRHRCPVIVAANKCDLTPTPPPALAEMCAVSISAHSGLGLETVRQRVIDVLYGEVGAGEPMAFSARLRELCSRLMLADTPGECQSTLDSILTRGE